MNAVTFNGQRNPPKPDLSEDDIARANHRHDQIFGPPGNIEIPLTFWTLSPPDLDKSLPTEELDRIVWEWMGRHIDPVLTLV